MKDRESIDHILLHCIKALELGVSLFWLHGLWQGWQDIGWPGTSIGKKWKKV